MKELLKDIQFLQEREENKEIVESILNSSDAKDNIALKIEDIEEAFQTSSLLDVQVAEANGDDAILNAMDEIVTKIDVLENMQKIFVKFTVYPDTSIMELAGAMEVLEKKLGENIEMIFGTGTSSDKKYAKVSTLSFYK